MKPNKYILPCAMFVVAILAPARSAPAQQIIGTPGSPSATTTIDGNYIPNPPPAFGGEINLDAKASKPWWPPNIVPPKRAPNILLIMTDDQGYGISGTFGGVIPTPTMDLSMAYTFDKANANAPSTHTTQYFEMLGNRAIYHDGWMASTTPPQPPWLLGKAKLPDVVNGYKWELYHIAEDYSQANDLAAKMPDKLRDMHRVRHAHAGGRCRLPGAIPLHRHDQQGEFQTRTAADAARGQQGRARNEEQREQVREGLGLIGEMRGLLT